MKDLEKLEKKAQENQNLSENEFEFAKNFKLVAKLELKRAKVRQKLFQQEMEIAKIRKELAKRKLKSVRVRGANVKEKLLSEEYVNLMDPKTKKCSKVKIINVIENPANVDYDRRGVITKGTVIATSLGTARVTSRPGQDGIVNAILVSKKND